VVSGGTNSINGSGIGYAVTTLYTQVTYTVTFSETGLMGETWGITFNGTTQPATAPASITFQSPNGTYAYNVSNVPGWRAGSYSGTVTVNGASPNPIIVAFTQVTYTVTFSETGLASVTEWYVNITGGSSFNSTTGSIAFTEPNGTYPFSVWTGANYTATSSSGTLTVRGSPAGELITFVSTYAITFDRPPGTPTGASWTVYVNTTTESGGFTAAGTPQSSIVRTTMASTLTLLAPNGTYDWSIVVSGNPTLTTHGTSTIDGSSECANCQSPCSPFLGFCGQTGYYILAVVVIVVVVVIGAVVLVMRGRRPPAITKQPAPTSPSPPGTGGGGPPQAQSVRLSPSITPTSLPWPVS
jgi:hypothetical protein